MLAAFLKIKNRLGIDDDDDADAADAIAVYDKETALSQNEEAAAGKLSHEEILLVLLCATGSRPVWLARGSCWSRQKRSPTSQENPKWVHTGTTHPREG